MTIDDDILKLVETEELADQGALADRLVSKGHRLTQSTLSRKLKKLGITKERGRYVAPRRPRAGEMTVEEVTPVPPNLLVVRTAPGHAHAIGFQLDASRFEGIVGTVAGDDTLFVAVAPPEALAPVAKAIVRAFTPPRRGRA